MSVSRLQNFFQTQGIEFEKLEFKFQNGSYHVLASENLRVGDVVAKIPKDAVLSVRTTAIADIIEEEELRGILGLGLAILYEKSLGDKSPWFEYLQCIPEYEQLPLFYDKNSLEYLQNTDVGRCVNSDAQNLIEDYETYIWPLLESDKYPQLEIRFITQENWFKVASLISSRAFQVDSYHGEALCPLGDLFNHKTDFENVHCEGNDEEDNEWEDEQDTEQVDDDSEIPVAVSVSNSSNASVDFLEFVVVRSCKKGDEVFNTYGEHPNSSLLRLYGFVELDNPYATVSVDRMEIFEHLMVANDSKAVMFWDSSVRYVLEELKDLKRGHDLEMGANDKNIMDEECDRQSNCSYLNEEGLHEEEMSSSVSDDIECNDGFNFGKSGIPSIELTVFILIITLGDCELEKLESEFEELVELIFFLKDVIESGNRPSKFSFPKYLNQAHLNAAILIMKDVAKNRLSNYKDLARPFQKGPKFWGYLLREEEKAILKAFLAQ